MCVHGEGLVGKAPVGIGIISWAHGHVNAYCNRIREFEDGRLVTCWDDDEVRGRKNAESYGIPYSPHLEDLLGNREVECVIVASETNRHADLCVAAARAGKAVLLQKPMALTLAFCSEAYRRIRTNFRAAARNNDAELKAAALHVIESGKAGEDILSG